MDGINPGNLSITQLQIAIQDQNTEIEDLNKNLDGARPEEQDAILDRIDTLVGNRQIFLRVINQKHVEVANKENDVVQLRRTVSQISNWMIPQSKEAARTTKIQSLTERIDTLTQEIRQLRDL
jgi:hypothetical protein